MPSALKAILIFLAAAIVSAPWQTEAAVGPKPPTAAPSPGPAGGPPPMCGGIAGLRCPGGMVCRMTGAPYPDQMGTCAFPPRACPRIYRPVCGGDGRTYPNTCEAERAGVRIDHLGACRPNGPRPGTEGSICAGFQGARCNPGLYCFQTREQQDTDDGSGVCRVRPRFCTRELRPVCGDNGRTYPNACEAARAGVNVRHPGICLPR